MIRFWMSGVVLFTVALAAAAQVYEWRDADGRLNYADRPPQGVDARLIRRAPTGEPPTRPQPPTMAEREMEFRERRAQAAEETARSTQERERAAERDRQCTQARNQLAALESGQPVARMNAQGEREVLDAAARTEEIGRSRNFIETNCP